MSDSSTCLKCDTPPPPCLCTASQQCVTISRSCTKCPENVCRDVAGAATSSSKGNSGGTIGGAVGGVIVGLVLFGWLYWFFKKRGRDQPPSGLRREKGLRKMGLGGTAGINGSSGGLGEKGEKAMATGGRYGSDRATKRSSVQLSMETGRATEGGDTSNRSHPALPSSAGGKRNSAVLVDVPPSPTRTESDAETDRDRRRTGNGDRRKRRSDERDDPFGDHHTSAVFSDRLSLGSSRATDVIPIAYIPSHSTAAAGKSLNRPTSGYSIASSTTTAPLSGMPGHLHPNRYTRSSAHPTSAGRGSAVPTIGVVAPSNASTVSRLSVPETLHSEDSYDGDGDDESAESVGSRTRDSRDRNRTRSPETAEDTAIVINRAERVDLSSPSAQSHSNTSIARSGSIGHLRRQNSHKAGPPISPSHPAGATAAFAAAAGSSNAGPMSATTSDGRPIRPPRAPGLDLKLPEGGTPQHAIQGPVSKGPLGSSSAAAKDAERPASGFPWSAAGTVASLTSPTNPASALASTPSIRGPEGAGSRFSASTVASLPRLVVDPSAGPRGRDSTLSTNSDFEGLSPTSARTPTDPFSSAAKDTRYLSQMSDISVAPSHMSYNFMDPATIVTPVNGGAARVQLGGRTEKGRVVNVGQVQLARTASQKKRDEGNGERNPFGDDKEAPKSPPVPTPTSATSKGKGQAYDDLIGGGGRERDSFASALTGDESRPTSMATTSPGGGRVVSLAYSEASTSADQDDDADVRVSYAGSATTEGGGLQLTPTTPSFPMPPIRSSTASPTSPHAPSISATPPTPTFPAGQRLPKSSPLANELTEDSNLSPPRASARVSGGSTSDYDPRSRVQSEAYSMRSGYDSGAGLEGIPFNLAFPGGVEGSSGASERGSVWSIASKNGATAPNARGKHGSGQGSQEKDGSGKGAGAAGRHLSVPATVVSNFDEEEEEERRRMIRGEEEEEVPPLPKLPEGLKNKAREEEKEVMKDETKLEGKKGEVRKEDRSSVDSFVMAARLAQSFADADF